MPPPVGPFVTARLTIRPFEPRDLDGFDAVNGDPVVMEHLPGLIAREDTAVWLERDGERARKGEDAYLAVERTVDGVFLGAIGLKPITFEKHFPETHEIGWRFRRLAWGQGYATEAARAMLDFGFAVKGLDAIIAFTVPANTRSQSVMQRLGMVRRPDYDFDHPMLPEGHRLRRHIVYRIARPGPA